MGKRKALLLSLAGVLSVLLLGLLPTPAVASAVEEAPVSELRQKAEEIEAELAAAPRSEALLAKLARTQFDIAETMIANGAGASKRSLDELKGQFATANAAWWRYLKVAKKRQVGLAALAAPSLFQQAELATGPVEADKFVKAAAKAQRIVAAGRPSKNDWSTLALYELFAQHYNAADEEIEKALRFAKTRYERESLEKIFKEVEKNARQFGKELKAAR
jgi:hypothetical protein